MTVPRRLLAALAASLALCGCASGPYPAYASTAEYPRSDDVFANIRAGMTRDEVAGRIGPPDETMQFARSRTDAWSYYYTDTWGYPSEFSVTFAGDRAVSKFSRRLDRNEIL
ncbi:MAG TPA: outer membrane protein assembly factor BamE [Usitatibacter sp.]|nr:outer membrane protein assembly factor BamE [Usitatibacter sp.]